MPLFQPTQQTLKICLLVLPESSMMTLASVLDVMRAANRLSQQQLFHWQLITPDNQPAALTCNLPVLPDTEFNAQLSGDALIMISGFHHQRYLDRSKLRTLHKLMSRFRMVGAVESASWILARTGKLNGKKATTHWEDLEDFALQFPEVDVRPDRYVIDGNFFTTGGASPSFDFMLHWIRECFGYQLALDVASVFIYDGVHQGADAQPLVSLGMLEQHEPRVAQAIRIMEQHLDAPLALDAIARRLRISVRLLEQLFSQHLQIPPGRYYLHLRLQTARRLVLDTRLPMQEIAIRTGFGSAAAFSRQFKKHYEVSPSLLRKGM